MSLRDRDEYFVGEECVAKAAVPAPQSMRVPGPELVAPETDRFVGDEDAASGQDVLDVPMAQVEAVVESDGVLDDFGRKSVPLVEALSGFHPGIVRSRRSIWQYRYSKG